MDGEIDQKQVDSAEKAGAEFIVGMKRSGRANSSSLRILTRKDVK